MLLALLLPGLLAFGQTPALPVTWYGPGKVSFPVQFDGDPYDPAQNDVRVRFAGEHGDTYERIAYFDGKGYSAKLVAPTKGKFKATLLRNGKEQLTAPEDGALTITDALPNGFIRRDTVYTNRFRWDSTVPYYPVGIDLGWSSNGVTVPDQLAKIGAAGGNWSRIWACAWDGKNPWWPQNDPRAIKNQMWLPALQQWQGIVDAAGKANVPFQFVLFHHGIVSSTTDANWQDNPWNTAKGGFLKDPADFFTDPEAIRREKIWLRYAVARYADSPDILSWELFNEVQWVDAMKTRSADVATWHQQMTAFLRSIDPYHHLVTSSSTLDVPGIIEPLDYLQPHTYPADITSSIIGTPLPTGKPAFYGEFGPGGKMDSRQAMRDGIYAGMLANQAGAGQYWYWDNVEKESLYGELTTAQRAVTLSELPKHPDAQISHLLVSSSVHADLTIHPGGGFEAARKTTFNLPDEDTSQALAGLPSFVQGNNHRDMFPKPIELKFANSKVGDLQIAVGSIARSGAQIVVTDNNEPLLTKAYAASDKDQQLNEVLKVKVHPGMHVIRISNPGTDWFTLSSITIPGIGAPAKVNGLEDTTWFMARITAVPGISDATEFTISGTAIQNGTYNATLIDLNTGKDQTFSLQVTTYALPTMKLTVRDGLLILKKT